MKKMYAALLAAAMITAGAGWNAQAADPVPAGTASGWGALAVGSESTAQNDQSTAIGYKSNATNAGGVTDNCNTAVGASSNANGGHASALGASANATGNGSTAFGYKSSASGVNSVALGAGSQANEDNTVSVGNGETQRRITYMAAGNVSETSTDAINGSQLYATNSRIGIEEDGSFKDITVTDAEGGAITNLTDAVNRVDDKVGTGKLSNGATNLTDAVNSNYTAIQHQGQQINALSDRVSDLGGEIDNVGAISAALAGLHPLDYDGTGSKFQLAAAMGNYDGTQAAAIGGFYHFNEDVMMSVGGATSFGGDNKSAFNVGVSFRVGQGSSGKKINSDAVLAQLEAMNEKIAALEAENQSLSEKVAALETPAPAAE